MNTFSYGAMGLVVLAMSACLMAGCSSTPPQPDPTSFTEEGLRATESRKTPLGTNESAVIKRFEEFNGILTTNNVTENLPKIYATDAYFRDPFKTIHDQAEMQAYLLRTVSAVAEYNMDWQDIATNGKGDYYFRWIMSVKLNRDGKKPPTTTTGVSHVRFGSDGKVIFHQDYFDPSAMLYEKIPIVGGVIRTIKKKL